MQLQKGDVLFISPISLFKKFKEYDSLPKKLREAMYWKIAKRPIYFAKFDVVEQDSEGKDFIPYDEATIYLVPTKAP